MDYPIHFADQLKQHLRALRKSRGLTQAQLAQRLGVVQSRIADIESNPALISVEQWFRLLAILDVQCILRDKQADTPQPGTSQVATYPVPHAADAGSDYLPPAAEADW